MVRLLGSRARLIGAMLLGNNVANIGSSALMTSVLVGLVGDRGVIYATVIMTVLLLVFAEVMPKTIAINYPERVSLFFARPAAIAVAVFGPLLKGVEIVVQSTPRTPGCPCGRISRRTSSAWCMPRNCCGRSTTRAATATG